MTKLMHADLLPLGIMKCEEETSIKNPTISIKMTPVFKLLH